MRASFVLHIEETSAGKSTRGHALVRVSDGSRWLTEGEATVTLNGRPLPIGSPDLTPEAFPTPGAVSTLIVSAPSYPTATYEIRAPGIPSMTSPASGATFPSGASLRFTWSPGPFTTSSWVDLVSGDGSKVLWSPFGTLGPVSAPPNPFDVTTSPIAYTGDAFAQVVAFNTGSSRYGSYTWPQVEYLRGVTFTP